ncbi:MAG: TIGR02452 family protein, partial [Verrucomicrobium sp.]
VRGSRAVPPDEVLAIANRKRHSTSIEVQQATTLEALRELYHSGVPGLGCLNFASAKNAGGGFLNGSLAQEESLACNSALYPCQLACREYYDANRASENALYTDWMIWSPMVPFIRLDDGTHSEQPYLAHVITAPAPNAGAVAGRIPDAPERVLTTLKRRAARVCQLAAQQGVQTFVLGAWGCGVFRNDPAQVARVFTELLQTGGEYEGVFERVVFAIHDPLDGTPVYQAFKNTLSPNP